MANPAADDALDPDSAPAINPALFAPPPSPPMIGAGKGMVPTGGAAGGQFPPGPDFFGDFFKQHFGFGDQHSPGQQAMDEQAQARQWYERFRAGDTGAIPAPDWLRRLLGSPVNPPHPDYPAYEQLNDQGHQQILQGYRQFRDQQTHGQTGIANLPSPFMLGIGAGGEALNATPARPIVAAGLEAKERALYALGHQASDPAFEDATPAQRSAASASANQLLMLLSVQPEMLTGLGGAQQAAFEQLGRMGTAVSPGAFGKSLAAGAESGAQGFAREAASRAPYPWELTRDEFYRQGEGNQFHGSYTPPVAGRSSEAGRTYGDYAGFFTTADPGYARSYATMSDEGAPTPTAGWDRVYRMQTGSERMPANPLDLINDRAGVERLRQVYAAELPQLEAAAKTPLQQAALREYRADLEGVAAHPIEPAPDQQIAAAQGAPTPAALAASHTGPMDAWDLVDRFSNMAINRARILGQEHPTMAEGGPAEDVDNRFFNQALRQLGHDAFTRTEMNAETGVPAPVTAFVDRPLSATSHRMAVEHALQTGQEVAPDVLKDYPDLQMRYRPVPNTPAFQTRLAARPLRDAPPEVNIINRSAFGSQIMRSGETHQYQIMGGNDRPIGDLLLSIRPNGEGYVHWVGVTGGANALGIGDIRRLVVEIKRLHPEITNFSGYRVSGSRTAAYPTGVKTTMQLREPAAAEPPVGAGETRYPNASGLPAGNQDSGVRYPTAGQVNTDIAAHPERYTEGAPPPAQKHGGLEYGPDVAQDRLYSLPLPIRPEDVRALATSLQPVLRAFGIGGRVQKASALAGQLSQFPPEAAQQLANQHVDLLSKELEDLYATGPDPTKLAEREATIRERANVLAAAGRAERAAAEHARADAVAQQHERAVAEWTKATQDKTNEIGKYESAARDVVQGRNHPTSSWSDQIANEIHEKIGFSQTELPPGPESGFMLARSEANMLLKKSRGLQTAVNNLVTGWSRALVKAIPLAGERRKVMYAMEPQRVGQPGTLHGPFQPGEPPPPPNRETAMVHVPEPGPRPIPDVIRKIMDEEYQAPGHQTFHLNEEQAYAAAQQRGLWPPRETAAGVRPEEAITGAPPPTGQVQLHNIQANLPPPVELSPAVYEAAGAIKALLARVGLHLVDNAHLVSALRQDFYPHIFLRGPNGETAVEAMAAALNPERRHPLNPDSPHFHRRFLEETLGALKAQGYQMVDDPAVLVPAYLRSIAKALSNQMVTSYIRGAFVRPGQDGRPAYVMGVQARKPTIAWTEAMHPRYQRPPALEGEAPTLDLTGYKYVNTEELKGWLHPDVYNAIRWQLEPPIIRSPVLKGGEVTVPDVVPFVGGRRIKVPGVIQWQQWDRQVAMWNPLFHGENQLSHHLMSSMVPGRLALLGRAMSQDPAIIRDAARWAHLVPAHSALDDMVDIMQGIMPEIRDPLNLGNLSSIPGRVNDWRHQILWEGMVRNAQVAAFVLERDRLLQRGFSREEASAGAGVYADRIVGAQDPATKLRWERVGTRYFMFAYNWTKTHVMQLAESAPLVGPRVLMKEHPFLTPGVASELQKELLLSTLRGVASSIVYTQLLNVALTALDGDPHLTFFNEKGREFSLDVTAVAKLMGLPTGGKKAYLGSPFLRFFDWYRQYVDDIQRANGGTGGIGSGSVEFLKNKLMAPWPEVWDQITHAETGGQQWSDWERVKHALSGGSLGTGGIMPTNVVGRPADVGGAVQELLPHGPVDLLDPAGVWQRMAHPGAAVGRQELSIGARLLGMNPPSYGPREDIGQILDPEQQRRADIWLAAHGTSPAKATPEQRQEAVVATGNEILDQSAQREQAFKTTQRQAVVDEMRSAGIANPEQVYDDAVKEGRSPFDELNSLQKSDVFAKHPELELYHQVASGNADPAEREVLRQSTAYRVAFQDKVNAERTQQRADDQLFLSGKLSEFTWRDRRSRRLQELYGPNGSQASLKAAYPQALITRQQWDAHLAKFGRPPRGITPEDAAYEEYKAIQLDDPKYALPDGTPDVLRWWQDRQQVLRGLPFDSQTFIHAKDSQNRTPLENLYEQASNKYLAFEAAYAGPAQAYHQLYQQTATPTQRRLLEAANPQLQQYITARRLFFLEHPAIAFFFLHGRQAEQDLAAAGVNPLDSPAQQLSQLGDVGALNELTQGIINQGTAAGP